MGKGETTRSQIVDRALELSTTVGLEGVSIGTLADELKLSKSGLFAHFRSKEVLQLAVIEQASERFAETVVRPLLKAPRGEPRLVAAFEHWRRWPTTAKLPGGCFFLAAAAEFDDRPGVVRDAVATQIRSWLETLAEITRGAVREGHFAAGVDAEQIAFELFGIMLSFHQHARLLDKPEAQKRARTAFEAVLARSRPSTVSAGVKPRPKRAPKTSH